MRTGDPGLAQRVRDLEHEGDDLKSANLDTLNSAFSTPMDREELYRAIATIDHIMNYAKTTIREMDTLNPGSGAEDADDRHICPLQLELIERAVRLWSNPGELICSPFAGIGSEGHVALLAKRRFIGCELKASYWQTACANLANAEAVGMAPTLFDDIDIA